MLGIIIKKVPIREYDELVFCYTQEAGKQIYQAKSILKPGSKQTSHLDIFNLVEFSPVQGSGSSRSNGTARAIITGAHALRAYFKLKTNLSALAVGYFVLECFDRLVMESEEDPKLWQFLTASLENIDALAPKRSTNWPVVLSGLRRELLEIMGFGKDASPEELAGSYFKSLQFARRVIK